MPLTETQRQKFKELNAGIIDPSGSIDYASRNDPDHMAEAYRLEQGTDLPLDYIDKNLSEVQRAEKVHKINPGELSERSPKTAHWLTNERNAAVAIDDVDLLETMERSANTQKERIGYWENQVRGFANTMSTIATEGAAGAAWFSEGISKPFTMAYDEIVNWATGEKGTTEQYMQTSEEEMRTILDERQASSEKFYGHEARGDIKKVIESPTPANIGEFIAEAGPSQIPYMIAAGISYPAIVAVIGNMVAEDRVKNDNRLGLPTETDMGIGAITAGITGLIERYSLMKLFKSGKVPKPLEGFLPYAAKGVVAGGAREGATEFIQEGIEAIGGSIGTEKGVDPRQVYEQALSGALIGGGFGTTIRSATVRPEYNQRVLRAAVKNTMLSMQSAESQDWLDNHIMLSQSSNTGPRAPEQFKEFLESIDPESHVYLSADVAGELENIPDYVTSQLDGTGADVSISMTDFLTDFAQNEELLTQVRPHVKVREDLQTQTEIQNFGDSDQAKKLIEQANASQEAITEADVIYEQVKTQLKGTRRQGESTAAISAQIYPAVIVAQQAALKAQGVDVSIKQLYEDMGLKIVPPDTKVVDDSGHMMNQDVIRSKLTPYAAEEFDYILDGMEDPDSELAFSDLIDLIDEGRNEDMSRKDIASIRRVAIDKGLYVPVTDEELKNITVLGGGKKYDFALGGKKYRYKSSAEYDLDIESLSQSEQTEYDRAVAKGLPMDEPARLQRARDMGFDTDAVYYHGGQKNLKYFDMSKAVDGAHYFSESKQHSKIFGETKGYYLRITNPMVISEGDLEEAWDKDNPDAFDENGEYMDDYESDDLNRDYIVDFVKKAKSLGHDGLIVEDLYDGGETNIVKLPFDPSNIRSINAAFDPDYGDSPQLLAQQDFGDMELSDTIDDNEITVKAQDMWDYHQKRLDAIEQIERCMRG